MFSVLEEEGSVQFGRGKCSIDKDIHPYSNDYGIVLV